jgi:uncharacterized protein YdcH (DUF465 family)
MSHTPHDLHDEFPQFADKIATLKSKDSDFATLAARYHELNRAVHRMETNIDAVDDTVMEESKKRRLALMDQIYARLSAH